METDMIKLMAGLKKAFYIVAGIYIGGYILAFALITILILIS